jgi:hypothetical protein
MVTLVNRAKMTTATTGTGTITLGSAVAGYQTFAAAGVSDTNIVRYVIEDGSDWEIGSGTYTSSGTTLSRTPTQSSSGGTAITLTGSAVVFITAVVADLVPYESGTPIAPQFGGTGVTTAPAEAARLLGFTTTVTSSGITDLTNASTQYQMFTGTESHTVRLPVTSTLTQGWSFHIVNNSTISISIFSSGSNNILLVPSGLSAMVTCIGTGLTTAENWEAGLTDFPLSTGNGGTVVLSNAPVLTNAVLNGTLGVSTAASARVTALTITSSVTEAVFSVTGTTPALSAGNGTIQTWTLTANSTPTDSINSGQSITLMINDGSAYTITWPSVTWKTNGGVAPTLNTTGFTVIVLWDVAGVLYGARVGDA